MKKYGLNLSVFALLCCVISCDRTSTEILKGDEIDFEYLGTLDQLLIKEEWFFNSVETICIDSEALISSTDCHTYGLANFNYYQSFIKNKNEDKSLLNYYRDLATKSDRVHKLDQADMPSLSSKPFVVGKDECNSNSASKSVFYKVSPPLFYNEEELYYFIKRIGYRSEKTLQIKVRKNQGSYIYLSYFFIDNCDILAGFNNNEDYLKRLISSSDEN